MTDTKLQQKALVRVFRVVRGQKRGPMTEIVYREESYAIQGAIFEVYRELGSGFLEAV